MTVQGCRGLPGSSLKLAWDPPLLQAGAQSQAPPAQDMALVMYPPTQIGVTPASDPLFPYHDVAALDLAHLRLGSPPRGPDLQQQPLGGISHADRGASLPAAQPPEAALPRSHSGSLRGMSTLSALLNASGSSSQEGAGGDAAAAAAQEGPRHPSEGRGQGSGRAASGSSSFDADAGALPGNAYSTGMGQPQRGSAPQGGPPSRASSQEALAQRAPGPPQPPPPPLPHPQHAQRASQHAQQQGQQQSVQPPPPPQQPPPPPLQQHPQHQHLHLQQQTQQQARFIGSTGGRVASWGPERGLDRAPGSGSFSLPPGGLGGGPPSCEPPGMGVGPGLTAPFSAPPTTAMALTLPQGSLPHAVANPFSFDGSLEGSLPGEPHTAAFPTTRGYLRDGDHDLDRHPSGSTQTGWQQQPPSLHGHYLNSSPERRSLAPHDFNLNKAITKRLASAVHYQQVLEAVAESIALFDEVNVATALHRLAKLQPPGTKGAHSPVVHAEQFRALIDAIHRLVHRFEAQAVSNTLWAFATLGYHPDGKLLDRLTHHAADIIRTFRPQATSNTLWAFAKLAYMPCTAFLEAAIQQMVVDLPRCVPQDISNAVWALAMLRHHPGPKLMDGAAAVAALGMVRFKPQEIANTLWAYANLSHDPGPAFLDAAATQITKRISHFRAQAISNSLWAYAKLGFNPGTPLLDCAAKRSAGMLHQHTCQEMANTLWAFAALGHHPGAPVLDAAATQVTYRLDHFSSQDVANCLWSFAELAHVPCPDLLQGAALCLLRGWHRFERRALATLLWSLALLRAPAPATWRALQDKLAGMPARGFDAADLRTLFRTHLLLRAPLGGAGGGGGGGGGGAAALEAPLLPRDLLEAATSSWQAAVRPSTRDARMKAEVCGALTALQVAHRAAAVTPDRLFCVDVALDHSQVVLLVEGPADFAANVQRPLGRTLARRAELEACGYLVCSIPYFDWARLTTPDLQKRYVFQLLAAALGWRAQ